MNEELKKYNELRAEASKAIAEGDLDRADELITEAEGIKAKLDRVQRLDDLGDLNVMRPPLPGSPEPDPEPSSRSDAIKAFHILKYGDEDDAVKAIMEDLYGKSYWDQRYRHNLLFNKFLRDVDWTPTGEDRRLLKTHFMSPKEVKSAIKVGIDLDGLKAVMVEAHDVLGGYAVTPDFRDTILSRLPGWSVMRPLANVITTSSNAVPWPTSTGGNSQYPSNVRGTWVDETPTAGTADTNVQLGLENILVHTLMTETFLSRNLVEDAAFNLVEYLLRVLPQTVAIDEDNAFINGDGVGKPQGILQDGANGLSLTEDNSGNASALTWDGLKAVVWGLDAQYRRNAIWIAEKATYEAIDKLKTGDGEYLWSNKDQQRFGPGEQGSLGLMRYPTFEQETMPSIAANAYPLIFGDPMGYTIVDRLGMSVERYLDSATARINQVVYVLRHRVGGQVTETYRFVVQKVSA